MEPVFTKGSLLIINPNIKPQDREYIIVSAGQQQKPLFKQVLLDGDSVYLKSHHPDIQVISTNNPNIIGVVTETRFLL